MKKHVFDVAVIGGGAAGLMAAAFAAQQGAETVLIEKGKQCGRKLLITGGGRCNFTNSLGDAKEFCNAFGENGRFLYTAFAKFSSTDTLKFFSSLGVKYIIEDLGRVFPVSENAKSILTALTTFARFNGVKIWTELDVKSLKLENGIISEIHAKDTVIYAKNIVLATGGRSYPATGSTGDGYVFAEKCGHSIAKLRPLLTPVRLKEKWVNELEGLSLRDVQISAFSGKKCSEEKGDILFTKDGMTGPAVYNISRTISGREKGMKLVLDMFPDEERNTLDLRLAELFNNNGKKILKNVLGFVLPPKMLGLVLKLSGIDPETHCAKISKNHRKIIINLMKELEMEILQFSGFDRATVTGGGVSLNEVDSKTMRSKIVKNLFFAGEVLDLDAPTGGYNLQMCWSTGVLAGTYSAG